MTEQQIAKLVSVLVEHQEEFAPLSNEEAQWVIQNGKNAIGLFVEAMKNRKTEKGVSQEVAPETQVAETLDPIIRVDRSIQPAYPDWVKKVMHPKLANTGPTEFDISQVEQWLHPDQVRGTIKGNVIYEHLKNNDLLKTCLGLADLLAIKKKGIVFFRKYFAGKAVFGWKSVVLYHDGSLNVPCLFEDGGGVLVVWRWLGSGWSSRNPALRLASLPAPMDIGVKAG